MLGSLPVVGYLFGKETNTLKKTMVVTAVAPVRVKNSFNTTDADQKLAKQAKGEEVIVVPASEFCFEQSAEHLY